ncbi:MAG: SIMPL domain-containing protein [Bryobacteraceae bacterium]
MKTALRLAPVLILASALAAQTRPQIRAAGQGIVSVKPDQLKLSLAVQTQAATADEAATQNSTRVTAVLAAVRNILGQDADIRTIGYSLNPNYRTPTMGGQPVVVGFIATNTVEVTTQDLGAAGKLIDASIQAGATNVQGLRFGLRDPEPVRRQALRLATTQARADVEAIAAGLNARLGMVLSAEESSAVSSFPSFDSRVAGGAATPVETGNVEVSATVVLTMEIAGQ